MNAIWAVRNMRSGRCRRVLDMIDQARPSRSLPDKLWNIIFEELNLYFASEITEDMLIDHLESRVGLYLGERN